MELPGALRPGNSWKGVASLTGQISDHRAKSCKRTETSTLPPTLAN